MEVYKDKNLTLHEGWHEIYIKDTCVFQKKELLRMPLRTMYKHERNAS